MLPTVIHSDLWCQHRSIFARIHIGMLDVCTTAVHVLVVKHSYCDLYSIYGTAFLRQSLRTKDLIDGDIDNMIRWMSSRDSTGGGNPSHTIQIEYSTAYSIFKFRM
jgi:hypothetical protein